MRVKDPTLWRDDGGYDGTFRVIRSQFIPDEIDWDEEEARRDAYGDDYRTYKSQTQREQYGHSQHVELRVTRHKRHMLEWNFRVHRTISFTGGWLELVHRRGK